MKNKHKSTPTTDIPEKQREDIHETAIYGYFSNIQIHIKKECANFDELQQYKHTPLIDDFFILMITLIIVFLLLNN